MVAEGDQFCPNEYGTAETEGCPDPDGDGLGNHVDACDNAAGLLEDQGCPPDGKRGGKADFTGDGKEDLVVAKKNGAGMQLILLRSLGSKFAAPVVWSDQPGMEWAKSKIVVGDFDRDKRADVMVIYDDGGATSFHFFRAGKDLFLDPVVWGSELPIDWAASKIVSADFTGDARADLLVMHDGQVSFKLYRSLGRPFGAPETWATPDLEWAKSKLVAGDYTGDGKADLVVAYEDGSGNVELRVFRSVGNAFAAPATWRAGTGLAWARSKVVTGDFDGDKRPDVGVFYDVDPGVSFSFFRAVKNGFYVPKSWTSQSGWSWASSKVIAADVTGDLRADVVVLYDGDPGTKARTFRSLRTSLAAPLDWLTTDWDWAATKVA